MRCVIYILMAILILMFLVIVRTGPIIGLSIMIPYIIYVYYKIITDKNVEL